MVVPIVMLGQLVGKGGEGRVPVPMGTVPTGVEPVPMGAVPLVLRVPLRGGAVLVKEAGEVPVPVGGGAGEDGAVPGEVPAGGR